MEELKKIYLYRPEVKTKPFIDDNDLQICLTSLQKKEAAIDLKSIYYKYIRKSASIEGNIASQRSLKDFDIDYASWCEIHDQLFDVYQELINSRNKE